MSNWLVYYGNGYVAQGWSRAQRAQNVDIIASYFYSQGWTINAIAAMLGNMELESYINPGQWEHGYAIEVPGQRSGFGLVQWTPWEKYTTWAGADWKTNYDKQLYRIQYEVDWDTESPNTGQWQKKASYPLSFLEFTRANEDVANVRWLALCFFNDYERGVGGETARQDNAEYWYTYLQNNPPQPWNPEPPTPGSFGGSFKIMMYMKPWWKR